MRKLWILALIVGLAFGVGTASAQEVSVGYQGFIGNGQNLLSGLSVRGWSDMVGYEGTIFYGQATVDTGFGDIDADVWILDFQLMYAAVAKENSKFYVGMDFGYGQWDLDFPGAGGDADDSFWMVGPLVGAEYSFQGLPELGFNWEVSYEFINADVDDAGMELDLNGINVTAGVHYKF